MRKIKWIVCMMLLLFTCILLFSACEKMDNTISSGTPGSSGEAPTEETHTHAFGEWKTSKAATCTEEGSEERACTCGDKEVRSVALLAHTPVTDAAVPESCTENGLTEGSHCGVCNKVLVAQEEILAHHTFDEEKMVVALSEDGRNATVDNVCSICEETEHGPYTGAFVRETEAFMFTDGARVDIVKEMILYRKNFYYVIENQIQTDVTVILENKVHFFGEDGKRQDKVFDHEELEIDGNTYYIVNNEVQINAYVRIENNVYFYGEDGAKSEAPISNQEIVDIEGDTYYLINNEIQINTYIRIENNVYFYGEDGVKSKTPLTEREVTVDGDVYYVINNEIQVSVYVRVETNVYYYGSNGVKDSAPITNKEITDNKGNIYYVINNEIQINAYIRIENNVYFYGEDGIKSKAPLTEREVTVGGDVYYVINNEIQINAYIRIENNVYFYGNDGAKNDAPITNKEITDNKGKTYYVINNEIQINAYIRIENNVYFYGDDGVKNDAPVTNKEITDNKGNTYYVINNEIQINAYIRIENNVYFYGNDGVKNDAPITNKEITDNKGNTYYVINNKVQIDAYIRIENNVYYYGDDGVKNDAPVTNKEITDNKGNTYYVINNEIQVNVYIRIENNVYFYGNDGAKNDAPITDKEITDNKGNTYYVINNEVQINAYIRIENNVYFYGNNGVKNEAPITDREITDHKGNTYYVIDNEIQVNVYIRIENNVYYYGDSGVKDRSPVTNREVTDNKGNTYYVINNKVQIDAYIRIENNVYYYGDDGVKSTTALTNQKITDNKGKTYYVINNKIQINLYVFIENRIYFFGENGVLLVNSTHGGYAFGSNGYILGSNIYIEIGGILYEITDSLASVHTHNHVPTVTPPTCTEDGYTTNECRCGDSYTTDRVPATGHSYGAWFETLAPNCTEEGSERRICANDSRHVENRSKAALGHDYSSLVARVAPTCQQTGCEAYYTCFACPCVFTASKTVTTMEDLLIDSVYHNFVSDRCSYCSLKRTTSTGRVFAATTGGTATSPITGATLYLSGTDDKGLAFTLTVQTNASGAYSLIGIPYGSYSMTVEKDGYHTNEAVIRVFYEDQVQNNLYMVAAETEGDSLPTGNAAGCVINAETGSGISGITVYVRRGTNVTVGDVVMTFKSDASGNFTANGLPEGNYTFQFVDERGGSTRFAKDYITVAILEGVTLKNQNITLSRVVGEGALRVVLTWGSSPSDLDSHMLFGTASSQSHVYYSSKNIGNVSLDVDDTSAYGPETVTVSRIQAGYTYHYYVKNYSANFYSELSASAAEVTIYMEDEVLYSIPVAVGSGYFWDVFSYSEEDGFTVYNTILTSAPSL